MKNISKILLSVVTLVVMAACHKAEFVTYNYVTFDARRAKIAEACGTYKIGVAVHNTDKCIVTYKVTEGSAKVGEDFEVVDEAGNPDPSGTMQIAGGKGYIYLKIVDRTGIETGNKSFTIDLLKASTQNVNLGNTTKISCSIIDADAAINKLIGSWAGKGKDLWGDSEDVSFYVDVIDEDDMSEDARIFKKTHPNASLIFSDIKFGSGMESEKDKEIFGYFDDNTNKMHIYPNQPFNSYTFTFSDDSSRECYVAITNSSGSEAGNAIFSFDKDAFELKADNAVVVGVFTHDEAMTYLGAYTGLAAGFIINKIGD